MKKTMLGLGTLAIALGVVGAGMSTALAYKGDPSVTGPNYSVERHDKMTKAFENKDYSAWKNLIQGKGKVSQVVNKDNFAKFAEAHQLSLQGKTTESQKIRQDLGLGLQNGSGRSMGGNGMGNGMNR